jgi:hypothetical protein
MVSSPSWARVPHPIDEDVHVAELRSSRQQGSMPLAQMVGARFSPRGCAGSESSGDAQASSGCRGRW